MPKAKQSPAPYRDDPFDDFQGSDLDRDALSQKASSINRIDLNARKETKKKDLEAPNQAFKTRQAEAILEQTFSSSNRSSSSMTPRCKQILTTVSVAAVLLLIMASRAVESGPAILVLGLSIGKYSKRRSSSCNSRYYSLYSFILLLLSSLKS